MSETERVVHIGDPMPRVGSVSYHGAYEIVVSWTSGTRESKADIVDLAPVVLTLKFYRPLRDNAEILKTVHVIEDGTAIAWSEDDAIDMSATTIERLAEETMSSADFRAWLERHNFTYDAASAQLGISRRLVAYYASKRHVPRYIALACRYLDGQLSSKNTLERSVPASGFLDDVLRGEFAQINTLRETLEHRSAIADAIDKLVKEIRSPSSSARAAVPAGPQGTTKPRRPQS